METSLIPFQSYYGHVYKVTNLINGKIYIGQTIKIGKRFLEYYGSGKYIKRAIKKHGITNFIKEIIWFCKTKEELNEQEIFWIKLYNSTDRKIGYNIREGGIGGINNGHVCSDEAKQKISKANTGKRRTDEQKEKIKKALKESEANKKRLENLSMSEETKEKLRIVNTGRKRSEETKQRQSESAKNRPPITEETRKKLIKNSTGRIFSEETKEKISKYHKGKPRSLESRQKQKETRSMREYRHSDEWKENMSRRNSGEGNPFFGKHHSEETKEKARNRKVSEETRKKQSDARLGRFSGKNSPSYIVIPEDIKNKVIEMRLQGLSDRKIPLYFDSIISRGIVKRIMKEYYEDINNNTRK